MTNLFTQSFDSLLQQATGQVPVQQPNQQPAQPTQAQPTQPAQVQQPAQAQPAQQPVQTQPVNNTQGYVVDVFGGNDTPQTPPQTHYNGFPTSVAPEQTVAQPTPQAQPIVETKAEEPKVEEPKVEPKAEESKAEVKAEEPKVEVKAEEPKVETKKATKKATKKKATKAEPKVEEQAITVDHILDEETKKAVADQLYSTMYELAFGVIKTAITDAATAAINDLKGK